MLLQASKHPSVQWRRCLVPTSPSSARRSISGRTAAASIWGLRPCASPTCNARVASLGYEVEDWGNIPVEQKEAWPEGDPHAKYLAQIASACKALAARVERGPRARTICPWCWAAIIRSPSAPSAACRSHFRARSEKRRPDLAGRPRRHEHARDQPQRQHARHAAGLHPRARARAELADLFGYRPKVDPRNAVIVGLRDVDATGEAARARLRRPRVHHARYRRARPARRHGGGDPHRQRRHGRIPPLARYGLLRPRGRARASARRCAAAPPIAKRIWPWK